MSAVVNIAIINRLLLYPGIVFRDMEIATPNSSFSLSTTHYLLLSSFYLLPTTYYLLSTTYLYFAIWKSRLPTQASHYQLLSSYYLLPTTYYLLLSTYYLLPTTYFFHKRHRYRSNCAAKTFKSNQHFMISFYFNKFTHHPF